MLKQWRTGHGSASETTTCLTSEPSNPFDGIAFSEDKRRLLELNFLVSLVAFDRDHGLEKNWWYYKLNFPNDRWKYVEEYRIMYETRETAGSKPDTPPEPDKDFTEWLRESTANTVAKTGEVDGLRLEVARLTAENVSLKQERDGVRVALKNGMGLNTPTSGETTPELSDLRDLPAIIRKLCTGITTLRLAKDKGTSRMESQTAVMRTMANEISALKNEISTLKSVPKAEL
jgi:hypothetical protein